MSEFDDFEGAQQPQEEEDPAAAFLAREQDVLAELDSVTDNFESSEPSGETGGASEANLFDPLEGSADNAVNDAIEPSSGDGLFDPYSSEPAAEEPEAQGYAAISQADRLASEPEKIRIWREQQKQMLEEKDAEEEKKIAEMRAIAKKELEEWYKHRAEQFEKTKIANRADPNAFEIKEAEDAFVGERDSSTPAVTTCQDWEKICRNCEFNPKHTRSQKDVSRMRSILLQLKQTPLVR